MYHFDFYRFDRSGGMGDAGFRECFDGRSIVPDRMAGESRRTAAADADLRIRLATPPDGRSRCARSKRRRRSGARVLAATLARVCTRRAAPQRSVALVPARSSRAGARAERSAIAVSARVAAQDYTRVTLESGAAFRYSLTALKNPDRLVARPRGRRLSEHADQARGQGRSATIRTSRVAARRQFKPGTVRLVVDLKGEVKPQVFALQPVGEYGHRLVIDVYPLVAPDPLMALLEQTGERPRRVSRRPLRSRRRRRARRASPLRPSSGRSSRGWSRSRSMPGTAARIPARSAAAAPTRST